MAQKEKPCRHERQATGRTVARTPTRACGAETRRFVEAIRRYAERNRIDIVSFRRGEHNDERIPSNRNSRYPAR